MSDETRFGRDMCIICLNIKIVGRDFRRERALFCVHVVFSEASYINYGQPVYVILFAEAYLAKQKKSPFPTPRSAKVIWSPSFKPKPTM